MRVIVAEKPSMGRAIAAALGIRGGAGQGSIGAGGVVVTWCIGHLVELAAPDDYDASLKAWTLERLPITPAPFRFRVVARTRAQFQVVAGLVGRRDVTEVVNACDAGREGELIFDLVYRLAGCQKPVLRLWTASLTDEAIRAAYRALKPADAYAGLRDAARSRQEADWLVGINATRAQTLRARATGGGHGDVYSIGRVQTPTLALLVHRDRAIRTFVPAKYWTVEAVFALRGQTYPGTWFRPGATPEAEPGTKTSERLATAEEARALVRQLAGKPARVAAVTQRERRRPPELLYDLTALQREANRRFGFSAKKTLALAQALYEEHKVLSYPRTGSRHLTTDVAATVPALVGAIGRQPAYAGAVTPLLAAGVPPLGRRYVDDSKVEDHHALLPTGRLPGALSEDERRLYDLVVRRLLAAHLPDRLELITTVITTVDRERFQSRGVVVRQLGWTAVDPPAPLAPKGRRADRDPQDADGAAPDDARTLPPLRQGDVPRVDELAAKAGQTKAPRPYTEADLLGAMETAGRELEDEALRAAMKDAGLGTPATRATIIEGLLERDYVVRRKKQLVPTDKGRELIERLPVASLTSPALTGEWEAKLAQMARGTYARTLFMSEIVVFTRQLVDALKTSTPPTPPRSVPTTAPAALPPAAGPRAASSAPQAIPCDACRRPTRVLYSRANGRWCFRCDPCRRWVVAGRRARRGPRQRGGDPAR